MKTPAILGEGTYCSAIIGLSLARRDGCLNDRTYPGSLIKSAPPGSLRIVEDWKQNIELTYCAIELMCITVCRMYEVNLLSDLQPPPVNWVNLEYLNMASMYAKVWMHIAQSWNSTGYECIFR